MKQVKSYTSIWKVEKVLHSINDFKLPIPLTFMQIGYFSLGLFLVMMFKNIFPLNIIKSDLLKYILVPFGFSWFFSKKEFDGKKPYKYMYTMIVYMFKSKVTFAGKPIKLKNKIVLDEIITFVKRSDSRVSNKIHRKQSNME